MIIKILEILRIAGAIVGCFLAYYLGNTTEEIISILVPWLVVSIAGLSGIEGLFFAKTAAKATGYEQGSSYQKQSAFAFLALAIMSLIVCFAKWGVYAELTVVLNFLLLIFMSTINHAYQAIVNKNYTWKNLIRPFLTIFLIAALWGPVTQVLFPN